MRSSKVLKCGSSKVEKTKTVNHGDTEARRKPSRNWHKLTPNDLLKADKKVLPYNHATQQCKAVRAKVNQHIIAFDPEVNFLQECRVKCILAEINGIIHAAGKPTEQILILYKPEYLAAGDQDRIEYKVAEINAIIKDKNIK